jgi:hypothetical protein
MGTDAQTLALLIDFFMMGAGFADTCFSCLLGVIWGFRYGCGFRMPRRLMRFPWFTSVGR